MSFRKWFRDHYEQACKREFEETYGKDAISCTFILQDGVAESFRRTLQVTGKSAEDRIRVYIIDGLNRDIHAANAPLTEGTE
jgi:hypothetical protein